MKNKNVPNSGCFDFFISEVLLCVPFITPAHWPFSHTLKTDIKQEAINQLVKYKFPQWPSTQAGSYVETNERQ